MARLLALGIVGFLLVACGAAEPRSEPPPREGTETSTEERLRAELHCTERPPGGEDECAARGCTWGPGLICRGTQAPDDVLEEERQAYERGERTCECVCPADQEACAMVP